MVPKGWSCLPLSDVCKKQISYGIVQTGENETNGIPCLRVVDLTKEVMRPEAMIKTSDDINQAYKKTILEKDEVVMALRGEVGLVRLIGSNLVGANITRGLARISAKKSIVYPEFLLWELRSPIFRADLMRRVGGSALQEVSLSELRKVRTLLPPLPEQKKIAQILTTWDKAISTTEQLLANSQQQKKALMQQLLTGKQRLLDQNGERFSGEWKMLPLGQLTKIFDGTHSTPKYVEDGIPFYSVEHLTANDFSKTKFISEEVFDKENKRVKLERGDILMTRIGDIGTAKHLDWDVRASFYVSLALVKASGDFDSEFMTQYINSNIFRSELWKRTIHVAFPKKINLGEISNCLVNIPSLKEQQKIAAVLSAADQEITTLQQQLDHLKQEKKALMQQLLTGKRRVKLNEGEAGE